MQQATKSYQHLMHVGRRRKREGQEQDALRDQQESCLICLTT